MHWRVCQHYNAQHAEHWYEHHPEPVTEGNDATILFGLHTTHNDRLVKANRPEIIVNDHKKKMCLFIDMTVPSDRNISLKSMKKISKYEDLEIEIQKMWHFNATVIPVVFGALGMIKKTTEDLKWNSLVME